MMDMFVISQIHVYYQVLYGLIKIVEQFQDKPTFIFTACRLANITNVHVLVTLHVPLYFIGTLRGAAICSLFKHYYAISNMTHSSACPMFSYIPFKRIYLLMDVIPL